MCSNSYIIKYDFRPPSVTMAMKKERERDRYTDGHTALRHTVHHVLPWLPYHGDREIGIQTDTQYSGYIFVTQPWSTTYYHGYHTMGIER
jgi:hypothetical protein